MPICCQLAEPENYLAFDWDMRNDPEGLDYWLGLFESFPGNMRSRLIDDDLAGDDFEVRWDIFLREYESGMSSRRLHPDDYPMSTIAFGEFRQGLLDKHGWPDPYLGVKQRENALAAKLYPEVIEKIDALEPAHRWDMLFRGLMAGNMFDLGAPKTIEMYNKGEVDFFSIFDRLPPRPWFIDDGDALAERFEREAYERVLFFVDNAGTDIVLGVIPTVREMARRGMQVTLAANSTAALNDITHDELVPLLATLAEGDPVLSSLIEDERITTVASGSGSPLIDLARISEACNAAARDCDLLVLEGMGRGVESNWRQRFACDVWRVALVKDACVARWLGCDLFQPVCRFEAGSRGSR